MSRKIVLCLKPRTSPSRPLLYIILRSVKLIKNYFPFYSAAITCHFAGQVEETLSMNLAPIKRNCENRT